MESKSPWLLFLRYKSITVSRRVRLYSTKTLKSLGTLDFHKKNTQALAFAHSAPIQNTFTSGSSEQGNETLSEDQDGDEELTEADKVARGRWLAAGSQDCRVSIWPLISFEKA